MKRAIFGRKNVLVAGGAGFIGSHICDELVKTCKVICLDNFSTGSEKNIDHLLDNPNFEFIRCDITQPIDLERFPELNKFKIQFQGVQEIYNLACPTSPLKFEENRIATILANSYGVKNLLDLAVKYQAKFMQFSSAVVYGPRRPDNPKVKEDDIGLVDFLSERSAYDEGKRFAETIVMSYIRSFGIDAKIVRLFRVYGPRMKLNDNRMIPDFVSNALDNKNLVILGNENFTTTFCYISDIIDAVIKIMDSNFSGPYNLGSDVEVNMTDFARKIIEMCESKSKIVYSEEHFFVTPLCLPDISKVRNDIGWLPIVTLERGLEKTIYDLRASKGLKNVEEIIKKIN